MDETHDESKIRTRQKQGIVTLGYPGGVKQNIKYWGKRKRLVEDRMAKQQTRQVPAQTN